MIEYIDADTGKKGFVMVTRIVRINEERLGGRAQSQITLDNGEYIGAYETAETLMKRVVAFQSWQTAIANDAR